MSYIRPLETESLPQLNEGTTSARRIRALEEELAAYRRGHTPRSGFLKYTDYDGGNGSVTRRAVVELQEQLNSFRDELRKKDALIERLAGMETGSRRLHSADGVRFETKHHGEKLDRVRTDVATLQVKNERLTQQLHTCEIELEEKGIKIKELMNLQDSARDNEVRLTDLNQSLQNRVRELEDQLTAFNTASNRGEFTVSSLQRELRDANDRILELESHIRHQRDEREVSRVGQTEHRLMELMSQLAALLQMTDDAVDMMSSASVDHVVRKLTELVQENAVLKGKMVTLTETLTNTQMESKASRDTIMRLVAEMGREQKVTTRYTAEVENLRAERDSALTARRELEQEISLMKERLEANERVLDATKAELELRGNRLSTLDHEMRVTSHTIHSTSTAFQLFREQLANLLGTAFDSVDSSEECLKEAVRKLAVNGQEYKLKVEEYEARVQSLTEQLNNQIELHREVSLRAQKFESDACNLDSKLRSAEGELAAGDVLRDGFRSDKEKYLQGLQKLGEVMKMDRVALDLGLDSTLEGLIARAEQLVKLERDALADRSTHLYNLQRKVRSLREQLESKDLHIDLLRKKLTGMEERVHGRVILEKDVETESARVRKLERLVEKYKLQLTDARQENENIRAQLMGTSELQMRTAEQRKDVEELARQVEELEEVRQRQARKISELKEEVANSESHTQEKRLVSDNAVQALSSELRTTKNALESIKYREKQLLDLRGVVSRMLGLDVNTLAVPDYEIISRLEKLIKAQQGNSLATGLAGVAMDTDDGLVISELETSDADVHRSRAKCRRKAVRAHGRARSLSPTKRDPRVY